MGLAAGECLVFEVELPMDYPLPPETVIEIDYEWAVRSSRVTVSASEMVAPEVCVVEACPSGAIGPNCTTCIPGYSRSDQECVACPVDFFNPLYDDGTCEPCEPGMSTLGLVGQTACWGCFERCTVCPDGFVLWGDTCKQCGPGTQSNQECLPCEAGSYSATGKQCQLCAKGSYAPASHSTGCLLCGAHSQALATGASQCTCVPGSALDYLSDRCSPCLVGHYSNSSVCLPCAVGTACNRTGCFECTTCSANHFADGLGSGSCLLCVGAAPRPDVCLCPPGTFGDSSSILSLSEQCHPCAGACPAASFIERACDALSDMRCAPCSVNCTPGFYVTTECGVAANITCKRCSVRCLAGYFISKDCERKSDLACTKCSSGCAPGFVLNRPCSGASDRVCDPCPAGSFGSPCQRCPEGHYQPTAGSTTCKVCNLLTDAAQTKCYLCPPGHYRATRYACAECPPMTFGSGGGCESCVGGNFHVSGATSCVNPPIG